MNGRFDQVRRFVFIKEGWRDEKWPHNAHHEWWGTLANKAINFRRPYGGPRIVHRDTLPREKAITWGALGVNVLIHKLRMSSTAPQFTFDATAQARYRAPTLQQPSNLREIFRSGKIVVGCGLTYPSRHVAKTVAVTGADWCWIVGVQCFGVDVVRR